MQQAMLSIVEVGISRIGIVAKALIHLLDNISAKIPEMPGEEPLPEAVQSQLFVLRLIFVTLNFHWRTVNSAISNNISNSGPSSLSSLISPQAVLRQNHASTTSTGSLLNTQQQQQASKLKDPPALDEKSFSVLYAIVVRILFKYARLNDVTSPFNVLGSHTTTNMTCFDSQDLPLDFVSFLGLNQSVTQALSQPVTSEYVDLYQAAGRVIFFLSASNWDHVFARMKAKLNQLAGSVDDNVDVSELRVFEWSHLNHRKLSMVLQEVSGMMRTMKKNISLAVPVVLKRAIWNWIEVFPQEFIAMHQSQKRFEGASDSLFEFFTPITDNNKRKSVIWPFQTALLMLSPDILSGVASMSSSTETAGKKIFPFALFLETLRQSIRQGKLADVATQCYVDICKAAAMVKTLDNVGLKRLVPEIEEELKRKLFVPQKPFAGAEAPFYHRAITEFLLAFYRRDPDAFAKAIPAVFLVDSTPSSFKAALIKACYLLANQDSTFPWNQPLSLIYPVIATPFRSIFHESYQKAKDPIGGSFGQSQRSLLATASDAKKSKKARDEEISEKSEIFINLLKLFNADPILAIWNDKEHHKQDATKTLMMDLTLALRDNNLTIRSLATNAILTLHRPDMIEQWGPHDTPMAAFWSISSLVVGMIARQLIELNANEEHCGKHYMELMLQLLLKRNDFLAKHQENAEEGIELVDRLQCNIQVETALLLSLCSSDTEVTTLTMACFEQLCQEASIVDITDDTQPRQPGSVSPSIVGNLAVYRQFLDGAFGAGSITGRVAIQKKIRRMLRSLETPSEGILSAWEEGCRRWTELSPINSKDETAVESTENKLKLFQSRLMAQNSLLKVTVNSSTLDLAEDKGEWQNYMGFLCALGGCCLAHSDKNTAVPMVGAVKLKKKPTITDGSTSTLFSMIDRFTKQILDLLVSDDAVIREAVKEIVGSELSPGLYQLFFSHLENVTKAFDSNGTIQCSERTTFHVEQAISVLKLILERATDHVEDTYAIDFGGLVLSYTKYLNQLGRGNTALRIKIKVCQLVEQLIQKRELVNLREEIKLRNRFLETFVEWTSDFAMGDNAALHDDSAFKNAKLLRDLDNACVRAIVVLLIQLPLQPTDSHEVENVSDARGRLFYKYFQFFIQVIKRCRVETSKSPEVVKDLSQLKESTILALSNLLSANIDCGLKYCLGVGYHEDPKTRTAFMQVLTNILTQGAEFEGLADTYVADRYQKMLDLLFESDLSITLALCEACPASDLDDLAALLLTLFESRNQTTTLLKMLIEREVARTESAPNLFRRNSISTKLMTLYAKAHGAEYLNAVLNPVWKSLTSSSSTKEYEIDPQKLQVDDVPEANRKNLEELATKFLDAILDSTSLVPNPIKSICYFLVSAVKDRFPDANMNVVIGGFIFLRFVCPAVVSPDQPLGSVDTKDFRRALVLVTKIIQNLANNVLFGAKETFMKDLNPFLEANMERVISFLKILAGCQKPEKEVAERPPQRVDDQDLHRLHRYLAQNLEAIGKELAKRKQLAFGQTSASRLPKAQSIDSGRKLAGSKSVGSFGALDASRGSLNTAGGLSTGGNAANRKLFDNLSTLLAQLGPLPETARKEFSTMPGNKTAADQLYIEFMIRNEGRNVNALKEKRLFFEGGTSKYRRPVFYYIARRLNATSSDIELVMYWVLQTLKPSQDKPFDIVVDLSQFREENEVQNQWVSQFLQLVPSEAASNLGSVYIYNTNSAFKKFAKPLNRFIASKYGKKIVFINSLNEFNDYISPIELQLPKTTTGLDSDAVVYSPVTRILSYRQSAYVSIKVNNMAVQICYTRKQDVLGQNASISDILLLSEIDDVYPSDKSGDDEFVIKYDQGRSTMTFTSPKRDMILSAIENARSKAHTKGHQKERVIRPSDVPGTLLNMALLNMGHDDPQLRQAAYNLLCVLSLIFNFDVGNQLLAAKGMSIPGNNTNFITTISEKLAATEPHLTLEFLKECFVGFNKSNTELKHLCLEYMAPWLSNLAIVHQAAPNELQNVKEQVDEILRMLMDLTVKETEMYPSVQSKVWQTIGHIEEILTHTLDAFISYAIEHGLGSKEAEGMADTCVTLASANVYLVSGRIISRLRRTIQNTSSKSITSVVDHPSWKEICVLIRFCLMLSFNDRLYVEQYLPELFHIISLVVATGPTLIRCSVYGLLVNIVQSLCTAKTLKQQQLIALDMLLNEFSEPKFRLLFGISKGSTDPFHINQLLLNDNADRMPLNSLATVINSLLEVLNVGASSTDGPGVWRARWMSLAVNFAFQFNPALQPRAFVALGCLSKGDIDDDLIFQILSTLRRALMFFDESDCQLIISIVMCLTSVIENSPFESRYLREMFWIAMILAAVGHPPLFGTALDLLQAVLKNLASKNAFTVQNPATVLFKARENLGPVMDQIDSAMGVSFANDFGFSTAAVLMKGLRNPSTKAITTSTLFLFLEITSKYVMQSVGRKPSEDNQPTLLGYVDARVLPYVAPLWAVVEPNELRELLWVAGVEIDIQADSAEQTQYGFSHNISSLIAPENLNKYRYPNLYQYLQLPNTKIATLLVGVVLTMLENAEHENETLFMFNFLAECTTAVPDVMLSMQERLLPKMVHVLASSHSPPIVDAAKRILETMVTLAPTSATGATSEPDLSDMQVPEFLTNPHIATSGLQSITRTLTMRGKKRPAVANNVQLFAPPVSAAPQVSSSHSVQEALKSMLPTVNPLDELGFPGIMTNDAGNFVNVSRSKKYSMSNMCSQVLETLLKS